MTGTLIFGIVASILTAVSMIPQLVKIVKQKKAGDVSLGMLFTLISGLGVWVYYGFLQKDWVIIIANSFSFLVNIIILLFTIKFKHKTN